MLGRPAMESAFFHCVKGNARPITTLNKGSASRRPIGPDASTRTSNTPAIHAPNTALQERCRGVARESLRLLGSGVLSAVAALLNSIRRSTTSFATCCFHVRSMSVFYHHPPASRSCLTLGLHLAGIARDALCSLNYRGRPRADIAASIVTCVRTIPARRWLMGTNNELAKHPLEAAVEVPYRPVA